MQILSLFCIFSIMKLWVMNQLWVFVYKTVVPYVLQDLSF